MSKQKVKDENKEEMNEDINEEQEINNEETHKNVNNIDFFILS